MRIQIVGLGLMGGSLAGALSAQGVEVGGSDGDPGVVATLLERGWLTEDVTSGNADLVVLAMPPLAIVETLPEIMMSTEAVVTDIASVKGAILGACPAHRQRFVAGHPLCGNAGRGLSCADPTLFSGRKWYLVDCPASAPQSLAVVREMLDILECQAVEITAMEHDRLLARSSHLPQLLASALALASERGGIGDYLKAGNFGSGFAGMTRLAGSPPELWNEICALNREEILRAIEDLQEQLNQLTENLESSGLEPWLREAARLKSDWPSGGENG